MGFVVLPGVTTEDVSQSLSSKGRPRPPTTTRGDDECHPGGGRCGEPGLLSAAGRTI